MLGNDVVDLLDVDARPETFRRRFDERVFAEDERRAIAEDAAASPAASGSDSRAHALRWAHWAAKEAAYKLLRQADPCFVFSPRRLVARFEPSLAFEPTSEPISEPTFERRGRLEVVGVASPLASALSLRSFETRDFVHVVALPADGDWESVTTGIEATSLRPSSSSSSPPPPPPAPTAATAAERVAAAGQSSAAVRALAVRVLARELEVDVARLTIGRRGRIPTVELDGRTLPVPLSLSHHGRFVAFAAAGGPRGFSRVRIASVRRTSGEGGGPFASADTAWMVG